MGILEQKSKRLAECLKNLYEKKMYSIEYVILELERLKDKGKITASDYEEYYNYFCSEMDKQNSVQVEEKCTENQTENGQNETESVEIDNQDEKNENQEESVE